MQNIIPITDLQQKTKKCIERVRDTGVPLVITQRGRAAAVLVSAADFEGYLIALDEKNYPDWREKLRRGIEDLENGRWIELGDFLKKEKKLKRRA